MLVDISTGFLRDRSTVPSGGGACVDVDSGFEVDGETWSPVVTETNSNSNISRNAWSVVTEPDPSPEVGGQTGSPLVTQTNSSSDISIQPKLSESSPLSGERQRVVADSLECGDALLADAGGGGDALSLHDSLALLLLHSVVLSSTLLLINRAALPLGDGGALLIAYGRTLLQILTDKLAMSIIC